MSTLSGDRLQTLLQEIKASLALIDIDVDGIAGLNAKFSNTLDLDALESLLTSIDGKTSGSISLTALAGYLDGVEGLLDDIKTNTAGGGTYLIAGDWKFLYVAGATGVIYTVPAGKTLHLHSASITVANSGNSGSVNLWVRDAADVLVHAPFSFNSVSGQGYFFQLSLDVALIIPAGYDIVTSSADASIHTRAFIEFTEV